jgi:hypothetical protein
MINNFSYITEDGINLKLNLGIGIDKFEGNDESKVLSFFKGQGKGVKWEFQNRIIEILEPGRKIDGNPTADQERVVVIYPQNHPFYPCPGNAVTYNGDGSIHLQLKVPELISPIAKERKLRRKNYDMINDTSFRSVNWEKNANGKIVTVMSIDFDWEWWESRVLNPDTGEFGECVGSGRR